MVVDLRSDTITRPSPEMRAAMSAAEVGDDVYGDDPTVNALQERCARLLGKEAGLFVPTGSMGNLVAIGALARPGEEVVCDPDAHFLNFEGGGVAFLGVTVRAVEAVGGVVPTDRLERELRAGDDHSPRSALLVMEVTHTTLGGVVPDFERFREAAALCRAAGTAVHIDGARLFNAQVASGIHAREWAECADTVTFCFSKGLAAPVGSMVCGSAEVIERARLLRKRLGGSMRQAGVLAAAAQVSLDTGIDRLADDHANARRLAAGLAGLATGAADPDEVHTNIVHVEAGALGGRSADRLLGELRDGGVLAKRYGSGLVRLVTHRDVDADDVDRALEVFAGISSG